MAIGGGKFFRTLVEDYRIHFVSRVRVHQLTIHADILRIVKADRNRPKSTRGLRWRRMTETRLPSKQHPGGEVRTLEFVGLEGLCVEDDEGHAMEISVVVVYECDENGNPVVDPDDPTRPLITIHATDT